MTTTAVAALRQGPMREPRSEKWTAGPRRRSAMLAEGRDGRRREAKQDRESSQALRLPASTRW